MAQAYDFALENMGMDIASYPIWNDYIRFLKAVDAVGSYAENQKITAIRKVYQKGIVNPMVHIEQLWYDDEKRILRPNASFQIILSCRAIDDDEILLKRSKKELLLFKKGQKLRVCVSFWLLSLFYSRGRRRLSSSLALWNLLSCLEGPF